MSIFRPPIGFLVPLALSLLAACNTSTSDNSSRGAADCDCSDTCPDCAKSMPCPEGTVLCCGDEPYAPFGCTRPDGPQHGPWKEFEIRDDRSWMETDGWHVDGKRQGDWASRNAQGLVVRVARYHDGRLLELQWVHPERVEELEEGHITGTLFAESEKVPSLHYLVSCSPNDGGYKLSDSSFEALEPDMAPKVPDPDPLFDLCRRQ